MCRTPAIINHGLKYERLGHVLYYQISALNNKHRPPVIQCKIVTCVLVHDSTAISSHQSLNAKPEFSLLSGL